jgi:hypothetical protein
MIKEYRPFKDIMYKKYLIIILSFFLIFSYISFVTAKYQNNFFYENKDYLNESDLNDNGYGIQWMKNYGSDWQGGRFEGPQPIGDCDNDGKNELLIAGRDAKIAVMEWDEENQIYTESATLHSPFYNLFLIRQILTGSTPPDAGGFAIGDVTGDGENEIVATWYGAVYKFIAGKYRIIGFNSWIFRNGGANGDCFIGDCDNDGQNEVIMSGGSYSPDIKIPEIVILKWNGCRLEKVAVFDDPAFGYAFMVGLGDPDGDSENEITVGIVNLKVGPFQKHKILVLEWNKETFSFDKTVIYETGIPEESPLGGWCADSDMDGKDEIHFGFIMPKIMIFEWNGSDYSVKYEKEWPGEGMLIESLNIGDVDDDGFPEVCAGTDIVHILQWNGLSYVEEAVISETYGDLAVLNIGDCDNDGKNEINVAPVFVEEGKDYITWVFKYGWKL